VCKKVAQRKVEIRDFEDRPAVVQSFKLLGFEEKVDEYRGSEFRR
jgi:hypothetical protein